MDDEKKLVPDRSPESVEFYAQLSSMRHAVSRILTPQPKGQLTALDANRLRAATELISEAVTKADKLINTQLNLFSAEDEERFTLPAEIKILNVLEQVPGLNDYYRFARDPVGNVCHLLSELSDYQANLANNLRQENVPDRDLRLLQAILDGIWQAAGFM